MHVLVTVGSKRGGTEGIARMLAGALRHEGVEASVLPPDQVASLEGFDGVIVGGALYANRWHRDARRFVRRREADLRGLPVWFFSSGPIDDSAEQRIIPPTGQVTVLMERVGALGHVTFGGRLARDAKGFLARGMAKNFAGDFRDQDHIRSWAKELAQALPFAHPGVAMKHPAYSLPRLVGHAVVGWAICAASMAALLQLASPGAAVALHALVAPAVFAVVASRYFKGHGSRAPLPTALSFAAIVALLDLVVVAGLVQGSLAMFASVAATWLPLLLIFAATWATGGIMSTMPWQEPPRKPYAAAH